MPFKFTRRQWVTLVLMCITTFFNANCASIQAPFYPKEAEKKGCTATEYGFVFGVFELTLCIASPICGSNINRIGPNVMFIGGMMSLAISVICFGLLGYVNGHVTFITLSILIRIFEGVAHASLITATFSIVANEFPENMASMFATVEAFCGFGEITGPTLGGLFYDIGGYVLPFAILGIILFIFAAASIFTVPAQEKIPRTQTENSFIISFLKIPDVIVDAFSVITTSISIGFLQTTLEPHLRQFHLSTVLVGLLFVITGAIYAVTAPAWGWVCDRPSVEAKYITIAGCVFISLAFLLIGPVDFIPLPTILWVTIIGLVLQGLGISCQLVASFSDANKSALANGLPDTIETRGLVSGMWMSTFSLGAFIGPSLAGIITDLIGFRKATTCILFTQVTVGIFVSIYICRCEKKRKHLRRESTNKEHETGLERTQNESINLDH